MSATDDPELEQTGTDEDPGSGEDGDRGPFLAPDDVDPVDHAVDTVRVDEDETAVPGEWL